MNFPYGKLPDYLEEYYGLHANALKKIKIKYDPENIFSFPQGIGISECNDQTATYSCKGTLDYERAIEQPGARNHRGFRYVSKKDIL